MEDLSVGLHPIKSLGTPQEFLAPSKMAGRSHASPLDSPASDRASSTVRRFHYFLGFRAKSWVLGKVFVFVALFDYKHFLLRRRIRTRGSCIHARPHDHGIWFDTVWDGFVIWVLAVKLDSGYIGGHLGPLQSLTPSNFQYPPVSKTPTRVARVKSLIHDNQTLANFPLHPQSQHWASGCGPMWRSNRVLSNLRIGTATDARAQRSSRAVRTLARSD